jgi:hypothetical protein
MFKKLNKFLNGLEMLELHLASVAVRQSLERAIETINLERDKN